MIYPLQELFIFIFSYWNINMFFWNKFSIWKLIEFYLNRYDNVQSHASYCLVLCNHDEFFEICFSHDSFSIHLCKIVFLTCPLCIDLFSSKKLIPIHFRSINISTWKFLTIFHKIHFFIQISTWFSFSNCPTLFKKHYNITSHRNHTWKYQSCFHLVSIHFTYSPYVF